MGELPTAVRNDAERMVYMSMDQLLNRLGNSVRVLEQGGTPLGVPDQVTEARERALAFLRLNSRRLIDGLCSDVSATSQHEHDDAKDVAIALIPLVARVLGLGNTGLEAAAAVSVIIARRGLDRFCNDRGWSWTTD